MQSTVKLAGLIVAGVAMAIVMAGAGTVTDTHAAEKKTEQKTEKKAEKTEKTYSYVANAGDTYTQLVRKAVQTYGINNDVDLGVGRIIAIETVASEQSGWPMINEGQTVGFSENLVKTWVDQAMQLSDADVAAWATYAPYIDFDTRHIGE